MCLDIGREAALVGVSVWGSGHHTTGSMVVGVTGGWQQGFCSMLAPGCLQMWPVEATGFGAGGREVTVGQMSWARGSRWQAGWWRVRMSSEQ